MFPRRSMLRLLTGLSIGGLVISAPRSAAAAAPFAASDLALVDALTWGVNPSIMAEFDSLGRDRWLQGQLHPQQGDHLPKAAQQEIDALPAVRRSALQMATDFDAMQRVANEIADLDQRTAALNTVQSAMTDVAKQAAAASILRDLYAPDQLRERMTWFWFNHFNVHQYKANLRVLIADYERSAIRPHAMGLFRDLIMATLRHPAMLRFLDNADNAAGHINENYAREIMELHTMGVGSGYTQQDVEQLARILTGTGIDLNPQPPQLKPDQIPLLVRDNGFAFNPARHDFGDKTFLGKTIKGSGFDEVRQAVDLLCASPATAHHIAQQIAVYFVSDDPPKALTDRMAQTFMETNGDIAAVLETMIHAPEFVATMGTRFKDPVRYVLSAVRLAYDDKVILNTAPIQGWLNRLAEGLYNRQTPDGYGMEASTWDGSGQMTARFEIARQIGANAAGLFKPLRSGAVEDPAFPLLQNSLYFNGLQARLSAQTRAALDKAVSAQDWNTLLLSSPEFMQ